MKAHQNMKLDFAALDKYLIERSRIEALWELVSKPIKFPNRRRREDREIPYPNPKAA
jgi:hypothetical protein